VPYGGCYWRTATCKLRIVLKMIFAYRPKSKTANQTLQFRQTYTNSFSLLTFLIIFFTLQFLLFLLSCLPLAHDIIEFRTNTVFHFSWNLDPFSYLILTSKQTCNPLHLECIWAHRTQWTVVTRVILLPGHVTLQTLRYILPSCQQLNSNVRVLFPGGVIVGGWRYVPRQNSSLIGTWHSYDKF
jgi:hypothetical protein